MVDDGYAGLRIGHETEHNKCDEWNDQQHTNHTILLCLL